MLLPRFVERRIQMQDSRHLDPAKSRFLLLFITLITKVQRQNPNKQKSKVITGAQKGKLKAGTRLTEDWSQE